jgi:hypothetical protein
VVVSVFVVDSTGRSTSTVVDMLATFASASDVVSWTGRFDSDTDSSSELCVVVSLADGSSASASTLASAFRAFHGSLTNAGPPLLRRFCGGGGWNLIP